MTDIQEETKQKIRRSLGLEFVRMEDDFDETRNLRKLLTSKLVAAAQSVAIVDMLDNGTSITREDTGTGISIMSTALKALNDTEKANVSAITMKLRHSEQEAASAAMHKDRILVVLEATQPGRIKDQAISSDALDAKLAEMFDADIKTFELKSNPDDLDSGEDS